jgi:membrane associated rhomboid family serine protease
MIFDRWLPESQDLRPLTFWNRRPLYLANIVALVCGASIVVYLILDTAVMKPFGFTFDGAFRELRLWTFLTYIFVNSPGWGVIFGCFLMWQFGETIERHLGRRSFVRLLVCLFSAPPLILTLLGLLGIRDFTAAGMMQLEFAIFVAFATLYPGAKISLIIVSVDAWILAAIFVGMNVMGNLGADKAPSLLMLLANVGTAYAFIRHEQGRWKLPKLPRVVFTASPKAKPTKATKPAAAKAPSVDEILDKISRDGMQSLTPEERDILDKASAEMKRRAR